MIPFADTYLPDVVIPYPPPNIMARARGLFILGNGRPPTGPELIELAWECWNTALVCAYCGK